MLLLNFCNAQAQTKKKKAAAKLSDTVEIVSAQTLLDLFGTGEYAEVVRLGTDYVKTYPADSLVRMRYNVAKICTGQSSTAFADLDILFNSTDKAIRFYSVLPLIGEMPAQQSIFDTIVRHCNQLDSTHLYARFCSALFQKNFGSKKLAMQKASVMHQQINNAYDAANLGSFYPSLLTIEAETRDSGLQILQALDKQYQDLANIKSVICQLAKEKANYQLASEKLDELMVLEPDNGDYVNDRIDIALILEDVSTACKLIKIINVDGSAENKNLLANCPLEFTKLPLKDKTQFVFNMNDKKKFIKMNVVLDANSETTLLLNCDIDGDNRAVITRAINVQLFDSALRSEVRLYQQAADDSAVLFLWMSRAAMREIAQNKTIQLDFGKGKGTFDLITNDLDAPDDNAFTERVELPDGTKKLVKTLHLLNYDTGEHVWINNDYNNPLIVKLESDYSFKLIQVK
jgi:hypothetical protein